jgi:hypothetical protein
VPDDPRINIQDSKCGPGPETELLLLCARIQIDSERGEHIRALLGEDMDWEYLLDTSLQLGVMPLLYQSLNSTFPEAVPKNVLNELRDYFTANTYRNRFMTDELLKLLDLFDTHKISVIPYKGPVLAATVYGDLSLRQCSDLDIIVRGQDVQTAKDLLLSERYRPDPKLQLDWEAHFLHENGMFLVDLHWGISGKNILKKAGVSFAIDLEGLWERSEPVSFAGRTVYQFLPEDLLMIRCQDAVKEYCKDGWPQLKWICDLAEIIRAHKNMDWEHIMGQAKYYGNQRLLFLCLSLASDLLKTALPEIVLKKIKADSQVRSLVAQVGEMLFRDTGDQNQFLDRKRGFLARNQFCLRLKERPQDKFPYYLRMLRNFGGNALRAMRNKNDRDLLLLPEYLSFLYYPLVFNYYLLLPIWRIGKYGLRRLKLITKPGL